MISPKSRIAADYANQLLGSLSHDIRIDALADHPALAWRRSGLYETTGLMLPLPLASAADGALMALKALAPNSGLPAYGSQLVGERARLRKTVRQGRLCAGGHGRLIETQDGRIALNLVRDDDWDLIPAWLEDYADDWAGIEKLAREKDTKYLADRAAEIGLAVAEDSIIECPNTWFSTKEFKSTNVKDNPLIVDLSGLWAGPLASSLLQMTGARVIKVESPTRPDGTRNGQEEFYALLNANKDCVALNFRDAQDLKNLKSLLHKADVVIEASRPRAVPQLGIIAEEFMENKPGKIWARLTAYGQSENRIGFGDDIGVSTGLASVMEQANDEPCFVGDAIADPVNGLHLALIIKSYLTKGQGALIDLSMCDCLRFAMGNIPNDLPAIVKDWQAMAVADNADLYSMRDARGLVKPLGADNNLLW